MKQIAVILSELGYEWDEARGVWVRETPSIHLALALGVQFINLWAANLDGQEIGYTQMFGYSNAQQFENRVKAAERYAFEMLASD